MINTLNVRVVQSYDTEDNWAASDPLLLAGEVAHSSDKGSYKIGDGYTKWSGLSYASDLHTHTVSQIIDFPSVLSNPYPLVVKLNGSTNAAYNGSEEVTIDITPNAIGAALSSHEHPYLSLEGGTISGNLVVTESITGSLIGNATSATVLENARTILTNLSSNNAASFDGSIDVTPGVTGILDVTNGGTGNATGTAAYTETAVDIGSTLYMLGVTSNDTTAIKRDTNIYAIGSTLYASMFSGDLNGNATSATTATTANNIAANIDTGTKAYILGVTGSGTTPIYDTGVYLDTASGRLTATTFNGGIVTTTTNPSIETTYYPTWVTGSGAVLRINNGFQYISLEGTTSAPGYGTLKLGNSTASGTAANKYGQIQIYGTGSYYWYLSGNKENTSNYTLYLPNSNGCLVVATNNGAVGSATQPVYISTSGAATAMTGALSIAYGGTGSTTGHCSINLSTDTTSTTAPAHNGTFTVIDGITRDSYGHVTAINTKTVTLPADNNTDTMVTNTLNTTTKAYITGTTSATTNTGTQIFDTGVYLDTTAGCITATSFNGGHVLTNTNPTSATTYYNTFSTGSGTVLRYNNGNRYISIEGVAEVADSDGNVTTSAVAGYGIGIFGNSTANTSDGSKYGGVRIYGTGSYYWNIVGSGSQLSANRTVYLPPVTATGYLLAKSSTSQLGSTSQPIYVGSTGIAATCNVRNNSSAAAAAAESYLITNNTLYYAQALINGSAQTRSVSIYAPTSAGTSGYVLTSNGSGAPSWAAPTASSIEVTTYNPTSSSSYYVPFVSDTGNDASLYCNSGMIYTTVEGTSSSLGLGKLALGASTASGTAGNKYGMLYIFSANTAGWAITGNKSITTSYSLYLPNKTGVLVGATSGSATGSSTKPVYINSSGVATASTGTVGSSSQPVFLNSGTITACNDLVAVNTWQGDFACNEGNDAPATFVAKIYSCGSELMTDIHISMLIEKWENTSSSDYDMFNPDCLVYALNGSSTKINYTSVSFDTLNTRVSSPTLTYSTSYMGRTGLVLIQNSTNGLNFGRVYSGDSTYGGWASSISSVYAAGNYYEIDIWGAIVT